MSPRARLAVSALALGLFALGCVAFSGGCGEPPKPLTMSTDMAPPSLMRVMPGPEKSGGDVRIVWAITSESGRVKIGEEVYAAHLSSEYKAQVFCRFTPISLLSPNQLYCVPTSPAAILDTQGNLYETNSCLDGMRITQEVQVVRDCYDEKPTFVVMNVQGPDICVPAFSVREISPISTPPATYKVNPLTGVCSPAGPGLATNNYYRVGRELPLSELPSAVRSVE